MFAGMPGDSNSGWRFGHSGELRKSLSEVYASIPVPVRGSWLRRLLAFSGPGYMVSVGYMDPGNWATDLAGGSKFGYTLLSVIMLSNLMAILLQALSARLGIATGRDLAQACRDAYPRPVGYLLWFACELAIVACDLAEVIGTAIALKLLFGLPLIAGALITALDAFLLLMLMNRGFRILEAFIVTLLLVIAICFLAQIVLAAPPVVAVLGGFVPSREIVTNPAMLYIAIGILGATVMPHNLYLHSSIVQTRDFEQSEGGRRRAIFWATADSTIALMLALFINAAILIVAAAVFHAHGKDVESIEGAYALLSPILGVGIASVLFAVALLASGLNSTVTATLAGQIVMEGFLNIRLRPWLRRLITRGIAIVPALVAIMLYGDRGIGQLLILSQVVLSLQLPFAVFPLVMFTSDVRKMGRAVAPVWVRWLAWPTAVLIAALNAWLLFQVIWGQV